MIGVGGVVPVHICSWSPYLAQFQYQPDPMAFAIKTFFLMQIAVYVATLGAGGRKFDYHAQQLYVYCLVIPLLKCVLFTL